MTQIEVKEPQAVVPTQYDPGKLLDALCKHVGATSDTQLAKQLKVGRHLLEWIRLRKYPVSATVLLQIH